MAGVSCLISAVRVRAGSGPGPVLVLAGSGPGPVLVLVLVPVWFRSGSGACLVPVWFRSGSGACLGPGLGPGRVRARVLTWLPTPPRGTHPPTYPGTHPPTTRPGTTTPATTARRVPPPCTAALPGGLASVNPGVRLNKVV